MKIKINTIYIFVLLLTAVDQLSKFFIVTENIKYSKNTGIAFGFPIPPLLIITLNVILLFVVVYLSKKELNMKNRIARLAIAMVLAGGFSNLLDRIFRGYVIDFISIWKYPSFNIADIYITAGVLMIVVFYNKIKNPITIKK